MTLQTTTTTTTTEPAGEASNRVIEHVVPAHETFQPKRVICLPVDESAGSKDAIEWTIKTMVNRDTDQVLLLNVRNYSAEYSIGYPFAPYEFPPDQLSEMEEAAKNHSHQLLVNYAKDFQKQGIHVRAVALQGTANGSYGRRCQRLPYAQDQQRQAFVCDHEQAWTRGVFPNAAWLGVAAPYPPLPCACVGSPSKVVTFCSSILGFLAVALSA